MWLAIAMALALELANGSAPDSPAQPFARRSRPHSGPSNALGAVPFDLSEDRTILVPVRVDGQGPFRFLLDTGASQSVVSESLARRFGVAIASRTVMLTPAGHRTTRPMARLSRLELGGVGASDILVTVLPDDLLSVQHRVDGVIGQDLLSAHVYTIDYARKVVIWHTVPLTPSGTKLRVEQQGGQVFVLLPQTSATSGALKMIPDTGADGLVLFSRPGKTLPPMTPLDVGLLRTVSGHRLVRRVLLDEFVAGDIPLRNHIATLVPRTDPGAIEGDGLLPMHIFSAVTFNGPESYLVLQR
jgi:hypothetical protein